VQVRPAPAIALRRGHTGPLRATPVGVPPLDEVGLALDDAALGVSPVTGRRLIGGEVEQLVLEGVHEFVSQRRLAVYLGLAGVGDEHDRVVLRAVVPQDRRPAVRFLDGQRVVVLTDEQQRFELRVVEGPERLGVGGAGAVAVLRPRDDLHRDVCGELPLADDLDARHRARDDRVGLALVQPVRVIDCH